MPQYFFHLATPSTYWVDDLGAEFESAEAAYLDASRAALELTIEAMRGRETTAGHRFEIMDDEGRLLFELPFDEMIRSRPSSPFQVNLAVRRRLRAELLRNRELQTDLAAGFSRTRETLKTTRDLLKGGGDNS